MDSISDVMKALRNSPMMQQLEHKRRQLLADPLVQQFWAEHPELGEEDLSLHLNRIHQFVTESHHCQQCPGLAECPNDLQGHYTRLQVERIGEHMHVLDHKVACSKWISHQAASSVRKRIRSFYIDEQVLLTGCTLEEIVMIDRKRSKAVDQISEYMDKVRREGVPTKGLYLVGSFGTGKTFLMCYMLHEMAKLGYTGAILYMPDFIEELKSMIGEPGKLQETMDTLKQTDFLVFDDIGAENLNPWARDHVISTILNYRMNRKPTFYTSNYNLEDLNKHFAFTSREGEDEHKGKRLMERVAPFVDVVVVSGENKRGKFGG